MNKSQDNNPKIDTSENITATKENIKLEDDTIQDTTSTQLNNAENVEKVTDTEPVRGDVLESENTKTEEIKPDAEPKDTDSQVSEKPIKEYKRVNSKFLNKILTFLKSIKWAIPSFILLVIIQQLSWSLNMWIGKDGVSLALPIDSKIPIVSEFCYIYMLTFPIVIFAVLYIAAKDRKHYWNIWLTANITFIISGLIYFFFQTQMTKPDFIPVTLSDRMLVDIWAACKPINCFPSQHCVMGIALVLLFYNQQKTTKLWFRITNYVICVLILLSTIFLKQHFLVDMFGSMAIMIPVYIIVKSWNFGGFMDNKMQEYSIKRANKIKKKTD